jgi:tetratricopeptide repeat protein
LALAGYSPYLRTDYCSAAITTKRSTQPLAGWHSLSNCGERSWEADCLRLRGEIKAEWNCANEGSERDLLDAVALASELGDRPLIARCHLGLGKLYSGTGKREQAQEHLTTATTMYREMDMRFWLEQAEMEMRALTGVRP